MDYAIAVEEQRVVVRLSFHPLPQNDLVIFLPESEGQPFPKNAASQGAHLLQLVKDAGGSPSITVLGKTPQDKVVTAEVSATGMKVWTSALSLPWECDLAMATAFANALVDTAQPG